MNDDECFEELREKEIKRLTDSLGSEEPVKGILTDDEILKYTGNSKEASRIRLKRGENNFQDKMKIHGDTMGIMWGVAIFIFGPFWVLEGFVNNNLTCKILFLPLISFLIGYTLYYLYFKDYTEPEYKVTLNNENSNNETIEDSIFSTNDDLLLLFESKEKITREMIERKFPAPQLANTKFNSVLDNCKDFC